jgi:hypothetical protein
MTAPTLISVTATSYSTTGVTSKATASISVTAGDILVAKAAMESGWNTGSAADVNITVSDSAGNTWTRKQELAHTGTSADDTVSYVTAWTAVAAATGSTTVTFAQAGATNTAKHFGGEVDVWRGSDGVGATNVANNGTGSGAPSVGITTTQDNSALSVIDADWNATTGTDTWTTTAGTPINRSDFSDGASYGVHTATYADVGAAGSKTVGMSAPATQRYGIIVIEIKGTAAATTVVGMQRRGRLFSPRSGPSRGLRTAYAYPSNQIVLSAATGVFNETGKAALFRISELAAPGSFSETGKAALFQVRELAAKGTFNESGVAALFRLSEVAAKGTFNETGNAALFQLREVAAKGTFNETGNAALFQVRELASKGTFNETGKPVLFKTIMGSSAGSYVVTGNAAKLTLATVLIASTGSFAETGKAAAFRITQKAAPGSVAVTGLSTSFRLSMPSAKGTFNETGVPANFRVLFRSAPGSFAVSGSAAHSTLKLTLLPGVFLVNGRPANLVISGSLIPEKNTTLKNVLVRSRIMVRGSRRFRSLKNETVIRRSRTLP